MPDLGHMPPPPAGARLPIGCIGAGFIVRDVHLVAYARAGYNVVAVAGHPAGEAQPVAARHGIARAYDSYDALLNDGEVQILDIAVPPHLQLDILRQAVKHNGHIRGILAQKPLGIGLDQAREAVRLCRDAGITLAVNQNMRFDQSVRALKTLLDRGALGRPVFATIEMRSAPHWKPWARLLGKRLTLTIMSIHHLDCFRYWFGTPDFVYCSSCQDPRTQFEHTDGIVSYTLEYGSGMRACAWDDVWAGPSREGAAGDIYIQWRVEGTDGLAIGTIGWPSYPNAVASTIRYSTKSEPQTWIAPRWTETWFPDAFRGTMGELLDAVATGREPTTSGTDNLETLALLDACYLSIEQHRPVRIADLLSLP